MRRLQHNRRPRPCPGGIRFARSARANANAPRPHQNSKTTADRVRTPRRKPYTCINGTEKKEDEENTERPEGTKTHKPPPLPEDDIQTTASGQGRPPRALASGLATVQRGRTALQAASASPLSSSRLFTYRPWGAWASEWGRSPRAAWPRTARRGSWPARPRAARPPSRPSPQRSRWPRSARCHRPRTRQRNRWGCPPSPCPWSRAARCRRSGPGRRCWCSLSNGSEHLWGTRSARPSGRQSRWRCPWC
mmetsp:Transcript_3249/g.8146  ORF Transcript_3249/g.8146 Transcript_3249/m.8146 type:complete len:249 (+) Transcript_3249:51-797(+)